MILNPYFRLKTEYFPCRLLELGFAKLVNEVDMKAAAAAGLLGMGSRPLNAPTIEKYLAEFGIDPEFGTHSRIRGLSGVPPARLFFPKEYSLAPASSTSLSSSLTCGLSGSSSILAVAECGLQLSRIDTKICIYALAF
jgi:hypothetical protein